MLQPHQLPPLQNHSNSDVVSIDCNVKLAPNEEMNLHLRGNLWMKSLKAVSPPKADAWLLRNTPKEPSLCVFFSSPAIALPPRKSGYVWGDFCFQILFIPSVHASCTAPHHREFNPKQSFLLQLTTLTNRAARSFRRAASLAWELWGKAMGAAGGTQPGCWALCHAWCSAPASLCAAEVQVTEAHHERRPPATLREPLRLPRGGPQPPGEPGPAPGLGNPQKPRGRTVPHGPSSSGEAAAPCPDPAGQSPVDGRRAGAGHRQLQHLQRPPQNLGHPQHPHHHVSVLFADNV